MNYDSNDGPSWWILIFCIIALFVIMLGTNACSAPTWNNGDCPNCEVRYELRGVSRGLKYYSCPDCGKEVKRY
jgi:hypothetical protein